MLVSTKKPRGHGSIVSQIDVNLTGNGWQILFLRYLPMNEEANGENAEKTDIGNEKWNPFVVNRVLWDDGKKNDSDKSPSTITTGGN